MKLLLVCEHTLLREGLRHLLLRLDSKIKIFEAADFGQALDALHSHDDISLTLLSSQLSDFDSWAALEILREHHAKVPVVLLSEDEDYGTVRRAWVAGAQGFISRSASGNLGKTRTHRFDIWLQPFNPAPARRARAD